MHMHTYIHANMHKYIQYMHAHVHTHTSVPSCRFAPHTVVNCLYEFSWTPTMHNAHEAVQWVCVCVWSQTPKQVYHGIKDQKMNIYIYGEKNIHGHIWPSCACFRLPLPTSFRLSLPRLGQETSDVAEIDNPGAEKAGKVLLVFFPVVFLENAFFQVCT